MYMWDDHDYGGNDDNSYNPGKRASLRTYAKYFPHYPL